MHLKLIAMMSTIAACTMSGHALTSAAERRKRLLSGLLNALNALRISLGSLLLPLEEALRQTNFPIFLAVADALPGKESVVESWICEKEILHRRGGSADCLNDCDISALDMLFEHLGAGGRENQIECIRSIALQVEELLREARERASQVSKLYTSLGFLLGLSLFILTL